MKTRESFEQGKEKERLLFEIEDILRVMPIAQTIYQHSDESISWMGRAAAAIERWSMPHAIAADAAIRKVQSIDMVDNGEGLSALKTLLHRARHDLRMDTVGPMNVSFEAGKVFDYFDGIRKNHRGCAQ